MTPTRNVFLYPKVDGVSEVGYHLPLRGLGLQSIRVCFVDLRRDLKTDRSVLVEELRDVIGRSFC